MTPWAAIPVKPLAEGKSRLAPALSPPNRALLNERLLLHTLDAVAAVFAADHIILVSRDAQLLELAASRGIRALPEHGRELNDALNQTLPIAGTDGLLAISTDLPNLTPDDVRAMLATQPVSVAIAPDRAGRGTNALFASPAGRIPFRFGDNSFAAHLAGSRAAGIEPAIITRPGLAFDLDLPQDLDHDRMRRKQFFF